jgi:tetratricopeptide (TPR) repeat protein
MKKTNNKLIINFFALIAGLMLCFSAVAEDPESGLATLPSMVQNAENTSMPWSLMAGESLNEVSRLFYPKNKQMQQLFVEKSLYLSRYIQPHLNSARKYDADTVIVIPNIKYLVQPKIVKKSVKPAVADDYSMSPAFQKAYDNLVAKNEYLKQEIDKLNIRLEKLFEAFIQLKVEIDRMLSSSIATPTHTIQTPNVAVSTDLAQTPVLKATSQNSWYLLLPILSVLFVMGLFFMLGLHKTSVTVNNHYQPDLYTKLKGSYANIYKKLFANDKQIKVKKSLPILAADFPIEPVTKREYTGSVGLSDLSDIGITNQIDDKDLALEQAHIYIDLNREDVAIKLLKKQIKSAPKAAIQHWLLLLDIYRKNNRKEEFMQYAKLLHKHFNVMMPSWDDVTLPAAIATSLEQFEHISQKMTLLWENCEKEAGKIAQTKQYLDDLLMDNRSNERAGFSLEVFKEIMLLRGMLEMRQKLAVTE